MGFWLNLVKFASKLCMVIKPSIWQVLESLRKKEGLARYKIYAVAMGKWGPVLEKDFWPPPQGFHSLFSEGGEWSGGDSVR